MKILVYAFYMKLVDMAEILVHMFEFILKHKENTAKTGKKIVWLSNKKSIKVIIASNIGFGVGTRRAEIGYRLYYLTEISYVYLLILCYQ